MRGAASAPKCYCGALMSVLLDDLRQTLATKPSRVVFIVGTGVTVGALRGSAHASVGSWAGLLGEGLRRVHELGVLDAQTLAHYQQQLGLSFSQALLGVADVVSRGLGAPHDGEFSRWLRETVGAFHDDIRDRAVLDALADHQRRGVLLATTNYDHLLEATTMLKPTTWRRAAGVERAIGGADPRVLHLHGEWEDPDSIVLGTPSYIDVARDAHARAVLTALRTDRTLVFVGCGAGLRDPNLGAFLRWTGETFGRTETRHFRLCRADEVEALRREHPSEQRIFPLPYGADHADLAPFLRALLPLPGSSDPVENLTGTPCDPKARVASRDCECRLSTRASHDSIRKGARSLLAKLHRSGERLTECLIEVLEFAGQSGQEELASLCQRELAGYQVDQDVPDYRQVDGFSSEAPANGSMIGATSAAALFHIFGQYPEHFAFVTVLVRIPIAELERIASELDSKRLFEYSERSEQSMTGKLYFYAEPQAIPGLLGKLRSGLTRRLLAIASSGDVR